MYFSNKLKFEQLGKGVAKEELDKLFSFEFEGKEDFIRFYLQYNGVFFPDGAKIETEDEEWCYGTEVEDIYTIKNILILWDGLKVRSIETKKLVETHFPFAQDASGNKYLIEFNTGLVKYMDLEEELDGLITVASDFRNFCENLLPLDYAEDS